LASSRHILVFRFSALGDVAMTVPVIKVLLQQHPALEVTFVSTPFMQPLFESIERLHFYPADIKGKFNGITGLYALARQMKKDIRYDAIADLHDVVRTKLLRFFLTPSRVVARDRPWVAVIDKGRKEKEELTRPVQKKLRPLRTTFQRYADVFETLGFPVRLDIKGGIIHPVLKRNLLPHKNKDGILIGIAPFAKHAAKMYPLEKMKQVLALLNRFEKVRILLFGGSAEAGLLLRWEKDFPNVYSVAGRMSFADELNLLAQLDIMVCMDSANMHLASLYGVRVISIWGGTHPFLGFYGWGQSLEDAIQTKLPCRPSSVFGNKDCPVHGKDGCMGAITPGMIVDKAAGVYGL
jgi:ADP-heptose:LPS heptosyltransferase